MKRVSFDVESQTLRGVLHEPPGVRRRAVPGAVLAHGLGSSRAEWYDFPERLAKAGFATLAFDFRGHGESEGDRGVQSGPRARADLAGAIDALVKEFRVDSERIALVGHSLGAALSVTAAPDLPIRSLALLAPFDRLRGLMGTFEFIGYNIARLVHGPVSLVHKPGLYVPYRVNYRNLYVDPKSVERAQRDRFLQATVPVGNYRTLVNGIDAAQAARRVTIPTLVVAARQDALVDRASTRRVFDALAGPKEWFEVEGSGHSIAGDARGAEVAERVAAFLGKELA